MRSANNSTLPTFPTQPHLLPNHPPHHRGPLRGHHRPRLLACPAEGAGAAVGAHRQRSSKPSGLLGRASGQGGHDRAIQGLQAMAGCMQGVGGLESGWMRRKCVQEHVKLRLQVRTAPRPAQGAAGAGARRPSKIASDVDDLWRIAYLTSHPGSSLDAVRLAAVYGTAAWRRSWGLQRSMRSCSSA